MHQHDDKIIFGTYRYYRNISGTFNSATNQALSQYNTHNLSGIRNKTYFCNAIHNGHWAKYCDVLGYWRRRTVCYSGLFTTSLVVTTISFYNVF
jgi:hypothetical protein